MLIEEKTARDLQRLRQLARREKCAEQKDRLMAAALAIQERETVNIQTSVGRSPGFVQRWAYALRDGEIEALKDKPRGESVAKINGETALKLKARIDEGPTQADGVCTLRGKDIQRIAKDEFNADVSLTSVYRVLHTMSYSCPAPRPRHEKQDLEAQAKFKNECAPFFVSTLREALAPHVGRVRVFFMDEARFGQQGTPTRMWA